MLVGTFPNVQNFNLYGGEKKSAKGFTILPQRQLTHEKVKETVSFGCLILTQNLRITFSSHHLHTKTLLKKSLSAFDDERFNLDNGIDTMPFGLIITVHDHFFDKEDKFVNESLSSWLSGELYEIENQRDIENTVETNNNNAETPDPRFVRMTAIRESDNDSDEISNKNDIEDELLECNPFTGYEAIESNS